MHWFRTDRVLIAIKYFLLFHFSKPAHYTVSIHIRINDYRQLFDAQSLWYEVEIHYQRHVIQIKMKYNKFLPKNANV